MNLKRICIVVVFVLTGLVPLGGLAYVLAKHWAKIEPNFYNVSITDLVQIGVTLLVAVFITYLIKVRTDLDLKRYEIMSNAVDELRAKFDCIFEMCCHYIQSKTKEEEAKMRQEMKNASILVDIILRLRRKNGLHGERGFEETCKRGFFAFKKAITDSPFAGRGKYTDAQISHIYSKYHELIHILYCYKLSLYR